MVVQPYVQVEVSPLALDYVIKLVYPEWVVDEHRGKRIGFAERHRRQVETWPVGGKMLVYLIDHQYITAALEVTGTLMQGEQMGLPGHPSFPLHLPVQLVSERMGCVRLKDIQVVVPPFTPSRDMSYWPITAQQYEQLLRRLEESQSAT
jgi:hypothetical protein